MVYILFKTNVEYSNLFDIDMSIHKKKGVLEKGFLENLRISKINHRGPL